MDALNNRRRSEHNINYIRSPGRRNNNEKADYIGITISDDLSQKQLPTLPVINTSPHSHQQQHRLHSSTHNDYSSKANSQDSLFRRVHSKSDLQPQPVIHEISTI